MDIEVAGSRVLVASVLTLWFGSRVTARIPALRRFSIPVAVTGGILVSLVVALLATAFSVEVRFDLALRDSLLLIFFSTIGLSAKFRLLAAGGRTLAILGALTMVFLVLQNGVGVSVAGLMGKPWGYGLIGGSVSLAGGHGTAITWGELAEGAGYTGVVALGLAFATFGLILGGLAGGPISNYLIRRYDLSLADPAPDGSPVAPAEEDEEESISVTSRQVIRTLLLLAICLGSGVEINRWLGEGGVVLPGFLTSMGVGILLTNGADLLRRPVDADAVELFSQVSLQLFLAMSLMSMQLTQLAGAFGSVLAILAAQVVLICLFSVFVVFRFCGRDYDAAVIAGGFSGLSLGATPVGVANMNAIVSRFGASPKAFVVVPLVGAFLLDILNAFVIQGWIEVIR
jgi:ESS family glutamate:Na+ symporter